MTKDNKSIGKTRVNITMSDELVSYYQDFADEMGIPRSTAMVLALKTYKDQQDMLKLNEYVKKVTFEQSLKNASIGGADDE